MRASRICTRCPVAATFGGTVSKQNWAPPALPVPSAATRLQPPSSWRAGKGARRAASERAGARLRLPGESHIAPLLFAWRPRLASSSAPSTRSWLPRRGGNLIESKWPRGAKANCRKNRNVITSGLGKLTASLSHGEAEERREKVRRAVNTKSAICGGLWGKQPREENDEGTGTVRRQWPMKDLVWNVVRQGAVREEQLKPSGGGRKAVGCVSVLQPRFKNRVG